MSSPSSSVPSKVVVIGGGIIGTTSAYFIRQKGYEVTLIEKLPTIAPEGGSSYQNGGLVCPGIVDNWAKPESRKLALLSFFQRDSPFQIKFGIQFFKPHFWSWLYTFWKKSSEPHQNYIQRWTDLYALGQQSGKLYRDILCLHPSLASPKPSEAIFESFTDRDSFLSALSTINGIRSHLNLPTATPLVEGDNAGNLIKTKYFPFMSDSFSSKIKGVYCFEGDTTGNCRDFARELGNICQNSGVNIILNESVKSIRHDGKKILSVSTDKGEYEADTFVFATGADNSLLRNIGIKIPVYPVKGYTVEYPIKQEYLEMEKNEKSSDKHILPRVAIGDDTRAIYVTRFDDKVRMGGYAIIDGFNRTTYEERRLALLKQFGEEVMGEAVDWTKPTPYACLRPVSADGNPIISKIPQFSNLFVNVGHGTLGWTLSLGSGKLLQEIISNPRDENNPFSLQRFFRRI